MLSCIQHLQYYMCVEVIEPSWCQLIHSLERVNNVDEVLERHSDFLEQCLGDCMLTSPQLLKAVTTLCQVCVQFCAFIQEMHKYFVDAELNSMLGSSYDSSDYSEEPGCGGPGAGGGSADSFSRSVARYSLRFTAALLSVLAITDQMVRDTNANKLLNISSRYAPPQVQYDTRSRAPWRGTRCASRPRCCPCSPSPTRWCATPTPTSSSTSPPGMLLLRYSMTLVLALRGAVLAALHGRAAVRARHHRPDGARHQRQQAPQHLLQVCSSSGTV
ncbi:gamma-tubulin complex component 2 homolog isoform X1 [Cydia pomonella]|uniref:gamma-tubulin complex component 2 homolog isoform X1 n=1 Tax=Cydia pomonella TaxID=82600 RepID=UPI002ADD540B|nr:gamma-tubulin complex component 2 homolog isoform X1 [Cydia pomonella]